MAPARMYITSSDSKWKRYDLTSIYGQSSTHELIRLYIDSTAKRLTSKHALSRCKQRVICMHHPWTHIHILSIQNPAYNLWHKQEFDRQRHPTLIIRLLFGRPQTERFRHQNHHTWIPINSYIHCVWRSQYCQSLLKYSIFSKVGDNYKNIFYFLKVT